MLRISRVQPKMLLLVLLLVWGDFLSAFFTCAAGGQWSLSRSSPNVDVAGLYQDEVMPRPAAQEEEEELEEYAFLDYRRDGDHRPPVSRQPRPGPINNIKRPSPALWP
ncbi:hypothetical protein GOP47_0022361 [Adiantum capillus-veneris]|uniref:Uncharacterized protein n=1 Tax=Adiantum capillus-veneris TaxID=13818 RepID=A0A9D4Z5Z9_ADICA|nr:hypothetical protein GOP47_0022361 [Adiantum capillus-veneris]